MCFLLIGFSTPYPFYVHAQSIVAKCVNGSLQLSQIE